MFKIILANFVFTMAYSIIAHMNSFIWKKNQCEDNIQITCVVINPNTQHFQREREGGRFKLFYGAIMGRWLYRIHPGQQYHKLPLCRANLTVPFVDVHCTSAYGITRLVELRSILVEMKVVSFSETVVCITLTFTRNHWLVEHPQEYYSFQRIRIFFQYK